MKQVITTTLKTISGDRWLLGLTMLNSLLLLILLVMLAMTIRPNETQVITRYSSYGVASFYRGQWYALWNYGLLGLMLLVGHVALSVKLMILKRRSLALSLLWLTAGLFVMVILVARSVIKIAALG